MFRPSCVQLLPDCNFEYLVAGMSCRSQFLGANRWLLLFVLTLLSATQLSHCQVAATTNKDDEPKTYKLEGTVVNSVTGEPLRRALVEITPSWPPVLTGADGKFVFENLPDEEWSLQITKPGFFPKGAENTNTFQVKHGDSPVTLQMVPEAVLTGRVEDRNGEPVERALVRVMSANFNMGRVEHLQVGQATTDEDGNFRIANLNVRRCWVMVQPNQVSVRTSANDVQGVKEGFPAIVYYPSAREFASAMPIQLLPGRESEVRFLLPSEPVFQISGTVTGAPPAQYIEVSLLTPSGDNLVLPRRFNQQTGTFEIRMVPAGTYVLESSVRDTEGHFLTAEVPLTVQANVTDVNLALVQAKSVSVIVHTDFSGLATGSTGAFREVDLARATRLALRSLDLAQRDRGTQYFTTDNVQLAPGKYALDKVTGEGFFYLQSARCGSADLMHEPLVVPRQGDVPPIELMLRDDGGAITGAVHGAKSLVSVVVAVPENGSMQTPRQAIVSGTEPKFSFTNLAPGDYRVYAFDTMAQFEYSNPAVLADYSSKGVHITVSSKGHVEVDVEWMHIGE